jgi:DnaK suppressor protein
MNTTDRNKYLALLLAKREEIMKNSRQRDEICVVRSNDELERIQLAGEREFAVLAMERESKSLTQVGAALRRMEDGEFGVCVECEEPISPKRLAAVPWATYCLRCQEMHDSAKTEVPEPLLAA